ncbi:MAG: diadenylate cyclase CdaA [Bacteroidales bacterium]|nr:MAG: diadenylate cyclase CdaA [Bacteroidales bacterium]
MISVFITIRILDIIDILLVAVLLYQVYRLIKGTVAINIFAGIFAVYLFWLVVKALNMEMLSSILGQVIGVGVIALIIVFQQEIRRFLLIIGTRYLSRSSFTLENLFSLNIKTDSGVKIDDIVKACENMAGSKTGALIVIARKSELSTIAEGGDILNAETTSRLLESIFLKDSPLHDGAVIIIGDRIHAARCVLPTTENIYLPAKFGTRHRAALGVSEKTDALVIVVSEETGAISIAKSGNIKSALKPSELKEFLESEI